MALNPLNNSNLEQLALIGLTAACEIVQSKDVYIQKAFNLWSQQVSIAPKTGKNDEYIQNKILSPTNFTV